MNYALISKAVFLVLLLAAPVVFAQSAAVEWFTLYQEVGELYRKGNYERAIIVAKKALELAEKNVGPDWADENQFRVHQIVDPIFVPNSCY